jgi:hypothetical protein
MNIVSEIKLLLKVNKEAKKYFGDDPTMKSLLKNWKTTLAGLIGILTMVGTSTGVISKEVAGAIVTIATSLGLLAAKDGNVTGGTTQQ